MREHEKTAGGSRKGKKSRRRGFLFSSLCRPRSLLCVRVSIIFYVMVSHLSIKGGIDLESSACFFAHISHTTHRPAGSARTQPTHHQRPRPRSELFKNISISIETARTHTLYTINYYFVFLLRPPAPPRHRAGG